MEKNDLSRLHDGKLDIFAPSFSIIDFHILGLILMTTVGKIAAEARV
jgi:hypothetical protein